MDSPVSLPYTAELRAGAPRREIKRKSLLDLLYLFFIKEIEI